MIILSPLVSACTSESDRAYAEAKKCAAAITNGGDCASPQSQTPGAPKPAQANASPPAQVEQPKSTSIEESRVYLDSTESMKGFASAQNPTFTKLIESLSYAMPGCRLFKYGMTGQKKAPVTGNSNAFAREIRFSQDLRKPSFYDLGYNEDDVLFNYLADEDRSVRSVLITDGVYSAQQTELESEVVKAIDKWLRKGRFFGILVFTSPFEGRFYSENKRIWLDKVKVNARPFYAFVFSPDEKGFQDLRDKLSSDFKDMKSFVFPREAVFCPLSPIVKQGLEHKDVPPMSSFYLHMYNKSIFGATDSAELPYDLRCLPVPDYPVVKFNVEVNLVSYSWQQDSFKKIASAPQSDLKVSIDTGEQLVNTNSPSAGADSTPSVPTSPTNVAPKQPSLRLTFQKDVGSSYSFYHVVFSFSSKDLKPAIRSLSTEDDSQVSDVDKTYRFYEFVSALTTVQLQNKAAIRLPPPVFVTLTNR